MEIKRRCETRRFPTGVQELRSFLIKSPDLLASCLKFS